MRVFQVDLFFLGYLKAVFIAFSAAALVSTMELELFGFSAGLGSRFFSIGFSSFFFVVFLLSFRPFWRKILTQQLFHVARTFLTSNYQEDP